MCFYYMSLAYTFYIRIAVLVMLVLVYFFVVSEVLNRIIGRFSHYKAPF